MSRAMRQIACDKRLTWPVYVTTLRAKLDCSAVLLVVAPDPEVAAWARQPIELGHPGFLDSICDWDVTNREPPPGVRRLRAGARRLDGSR